MYCRQTRRHFLILLVLVLFSNSFAHLLKAQEDTISSVVLSGHENTVDGVLVLSNGRLLSWGRDTALRLWDSDGALLATLEGHTNRVNGALALDDGRILSWSLDGTLRLWANDGAPLSTLEGHEAVNGALALDDGRFLSWSQWDNTLRLWANNGVPLAILTAHTQGIIDALVLDDGRFLSWGYDGTLRLWDADGEPLATMEHTDRIYGVLVLDDGRLLSWGGDFTPRLWDADGVLLATLEGHTASVQGVLELEDGRILSWSEDNTLRLWDVNGAPLAVLSGHTGMVNGALVLEDGRILSWSLEDDRLRLWANDGASLATLNGHIDRVDGALVLDDGRILSWGGDNMLRLWTNDGTLLAILAGHTLSVAGVSVLEDGRILSWSFGDNRLRLWANDGSPLATLEGHTNWVNDVMMLDDGRVVSWGRDSTLRLWDVPGQVVDNTASMLEVPAMQTDDVSSQLDRAIAIPGTTVSLNVPQTWVADYFDSNNPVESLVLVLASDASLLANGTGNRAITSASSTPDDVAIYVRVRYDEMGNFGQGRSDELLTIADRRATFNDDTSRLRLTIELQDRVLVVLEPIALTANYNDYRPLLLAIGESLTTGPDAVLPITPQTVTNLERLSTRGGNWALFNQSQTTYIETSHSNGVLRVFDLNLNVPAGRVSYTYRNNTMPFTSGSVADDGRFVAHDGTGLQMFSNTGAVLYTIPVPNRPARFAITPNGQLLATAEANTVRVIYPESADLYALFEPGGISHLLFSPDSRYLAAVNALGSTAIIYDVVNQAEVTRMDLQRGLQDWRFSPTGRYFAMSDGRTIRVFDRNTNNTIQFSHEGTQQIFYAEPMPIAFSRDESLLVYADAFSNIYVYNLASNELLYTIEEAHDNVVGGIAINNAGTMIATAKVNANIPGRTSTSQLDVELRFWDINAGTRLHTSIVPFGRGYDPYYLTFSNDDTALFMVSERSSNDLVTHLAIRPGTVIEGFVRDEILPLNVASVDFLNPGETASSTAPATGQEAAQDAAWWDTYAPINSGNLSSLVPINRVTNAVRTTIASGQLMVSENLLIARSDRGLALYPLTDFDVIQDVQVVNSVNATEKRRHVLDPVNDILAVAGNAWVANLYNAGGGKIGEIDTRYRGPSQILGMDYNADGTRLITIGNQGSTGGEIAFWSVETGEKVGGTSFPVSVERLGLSPDRSLAMVVLSDGELRIFDVESRQQISNFSHFGGNIDQGDDRNTAFIVAGQFTVYDAAFTSDNRYAIFTASGATRNQQGNRVSFTNDVFVYDRIADQAVELSVRSATDIVVHPLEPIIALPYLFELAVVDISTQQTLFNFNYNVGTGISSTVFTPDGETLLLSNSQRDQDQFRAFDIRSGQLRTTFTNPGDGRNQTQLAFHPSGRILFFQTGNEVLLYAIEQGTPAGPSADQQVASQAAADPSSGATCNVTTLRNVNLRTSATTASSIGGTLSASTTTVADGQNQPGDGFTWWRVLVPGTQDRFWVRGDLVRAEPACDSLPVIR